MSDTGTNPEAGRKARILIVEDEQNLAEGIAYNLHLEGYASEIASDGKSALAMILDGGFDLIILDVMLPEMDGFSVCRQARRRDISTPILFLTAKSSVEDRIRGFELGADDYLAKPFHLRELLLRVATIIRRSSAAPAHQTSTPIKFGDNQCDFRSLEARSWDGREHVLSEKEALVLKSLLERPGQIISREDLLEEVWGHEVLPSTRSLEELVDHLRRRFERDPLKPQYFHTIRGVGYRFQEEGGGL